MLLGVYIVFQRFCSILFACLRCLLLLHSSSLLWANVYSQDEFLVWCIFISKAFIAFYSWVADVV